LRSNKTQATVDKYGSLRPNVCGHKLIFLILTSAASKVVMMVVWKVAMKVAWWAGVSADTKVVSRASQKAVSMVAMSAELWVGTWAD
jgi:hypothetical protein